MSHKLIERLKRAGFEVLCAVTHSPQDAPHDQMFAPRPNVQQNVELIRKSDVFVAVLKDYGKDLAAEVGMAYALSKPSIGIDYGISRSDVVVYYALDRIIRPEELEQALSELCK